MPEVDCYSQPYVTFARTDERRRRLIADNPVAACQDARHMYEKVGKSAVLTGFHLRELIGEYAVVAVLTGSLNDTASGLAEELIRLEEVHNQKRPLVKYYQYA